MKKIFSLSLLLAGSPLLFAQSDSSMNKDAVYDRPFISIGKTRTAVGGYVEGNTNYFATDGVTEGFSMELRRFNLFVYSTISERIKFLSELEFEHGTEEIALETALIDFELHPAFNVRAGVLLVPIGAFNQNHDAPKWEFVERPLMATQIIPSTLSEVGFGINGRLHAGQYTFGYETYLTNGLQDGVLFNPEGRTFLPAGKSEELFAEDNNGLPMISGKLAFKKHRLGEIGVSYYGGVYNSFRQEGLILDEKRSLQIYALDVSAAIGKGDFHAEFALADIDVPPSAGQFFGRRQYGWYAEMIYPVLKRKMLTYPNAILNAAFRAEAIDYNVGTFAETGSRIYDEIKAIAPGISFRPVPAVALKANYRYHWTRDLLGNPTVRTAGFQFGIASYF